MSRYRALSGFSRSVGQPIDDCRYDNIQFTRRLTCCAAWAVSLSKSEKACKELPSTGNGRRLNGWVWFVD